MNVGETAIQSMKSWWGFRGVAIESQLGEADDGAYVGESHQGKSLLLTRTAQ